MVVSPGVQTIYQIAGGNTTEIKIVVTGGIPEPEVKWFDVTFAQCIAFVTFVMLKWDSVMWDSGFVMWGSGFVMWDSGFVMWGSGFTQKSIRVFNVVLCFF